MTTSRVLITGVITLTAFLVGCAGAKIKGERVALKSGAISKSETICVKKITADGAVFSGDKADDSGRIAEEKKIIAMRLADEITSRLVKKGIKAERDGKSCGAVLEGQVTRFDHGSAAGRMFVGMGTGSSNMYVPMKLTSKGQVVADFDVVATSGGRGGWTALGSFLDAHIDDAAKKTAEYIADRAN